MDEISAVTQVPIFCPMMIGMAALKFTAPVAHNACRIPTEAEELWMIAVSIAPNIIPRIGFENMVKRSVNPGTSFNPLTALLIPSIPVIRMANPIRSPPILCFFSFLENIRKTIPINASNGENVVGLKRLTRRLSLSSPDRLRIQDVAVVPMFAPIIIYTACLSFIMPEFTNPTTITVVAEEDWIAAVTPAPSRTAIIGLAVNFSRILSSLPPESFSRLSPKRFIP